MAIESVVRYPEDETVTCPCGEQFHMFLNGGELDEHLCKCGRRYSGEHRVTVMVVENPDLPDGVRCPKCGGEFDEGFIGDPRVSDPREGGEHFSARACFGCGWHDVGECAECSKVDRGGHGVAVSDAAEAIVCIDDGEVIIHPDAVAYGTAENGRLVVPGWPSGLLYVKGVSVMTHQDWSVCIGDAIHDAITGGRVPLRPRGELPDIPTPGIRLAG